MTQKLDRVLPRDLTRRRVLKGALATSALATAGCATVGTTIPTSVPKTFVLVHGAWHGGWCWRDVKSILESQGHRVFTPTLSGLGERAHLMSPNISLQTHVSDILGVIESEELNEFVLVGHSYGGMVITGVADIVKDQISHIVYLDAALPKHGEAMMTQGPTKTADELRQQKVFLESLSNDGVSMLEPEPALFGISKNDKNMTAWVKRRLTPHPLRTWSDPISIENGGPEGIPGTYIICTTPALQGTSFSYHANILSSQPNWTVIELATGHDAMITAPTALSDLLMEAR